MKLPLPVALALADRGAQSSRFPDGLAGRVAGVVAELGVCQHQGQRELGWRPAPHEDCLEETIAWYRELDGAEVSQPGARQPLPLRLTGEVMRRTGLNRL